MFRTIFRNLVLCKLHAVKDYTPDNSTSTVISIIDTSTVIYTVLSTSVSGMFTHYILASICNIVGKNAKFKKVYGRINSNLKVTIK